MDAPGFSYILSLSVWLQRALGLYFPYLSICLQYIIDTLTVLHILYELKLWDLSFFSCSVSLGTVSVLLLGSWALLPASAYFLFVFELSQELFVNQCWPSAMTITLYKLKQTVLVCQEVSFDYQEVLLGLFALQGSLLQDSAKQILNKPKSVLLNSRAIILLLVLITSLWV